MRASFGELKHANAFSLAIDDAVKTGAPLPSALEARFSSRPSQALPATLREWVEHNVRMRTKKSLSSEYNASRNLRRFYLEAHEFFGEVHVADITEEQVCDYRDHLAEVECLSRLTAKARLQIVRSALEAAKDRGVIKSNPAEGVRAKDPTTPRQPKEWGQRRSLTPLEVRAIAEHLPPQLQLLIWLMFGMGLRIGEAFGLRLRHWDQGAATLTIKRQGGTAKKDAEKNTRTKTKAGLRCLPIPGRLNKLIADYVDRYHPSKPADSAQLAQWLDRPLVVSQYSDEPWRVVLDRRWHSVLEQVGLDFGTVGFRVKPHLLRKSCSTHLGSQPARKVSGQAWSAYMGHKVKGKPGASDVTLDVYFLVEQKMLKSCAKALDKHLAKAGVLRIFDDAADCGLVTNVEAADILGLGPNAVNQYVERGLLAPADVESALGRPPVVSRSGTAKPLLFFVDDVEALLARMAEEKARFRTVREAAQLLGITPDRIRELIGTGLLIDKRDARGGRRRLDMSSVERVARLLEDERASAHERMSLGQVKRALGVTSDGYVRALVRQGRLTRAQTLIATSPHFTRESVVREARRKGRSMGAEPE